MNTFPSAGTTDPWAEILHHLSTKVTFKGQPVVGPPEQIQGFARWMMLQLPGVVPTGDPETRANCFLNWLRSETKYEADEATRLPQVPATSTQAPPNPISDQTVPQLAQPVAPPAPVPVAVAHPTVPGEEPAAVAGLICPECGAPLKNLTGMKRHCTMTHKADWSAIAQKHGLDISTGYKLNGAPPAPAAPVAPPPPPSASAVPPMFGAPGQASAAPPMFTAPAPPPVGQTSISFQPQTMPAPPAHVAAAPQAPMSGPAAPMFQPPSFTPPQPVAPAAPMFQPPAFTPLASAPTNFFEAQPAAAPLVAFNPNATQQPAPAVFAGAPTRESMAQMLGGAVDLLVVKLLDAANVKMDGRVDVNQLAMLAEQRAKAEQRVVDLAQSSYGAGKQAAQRHFADLLTQTPNCYMLQNGYDAILPDGYLTILAGRVTKFHIVSDNGRQITTIFG